MGLMALIDLLPDTSSHSDASMMLQNTVSYNRLQANGIYAYFMHLMSMHSDDERPDVTESRAAREALVDRARLLLGEQALPLAALSSFGLEPSDWLSQGYLQVELRLTNASGGRADRELIAACNSWVPASYIYVQISSSLHALFSWTIGIHPSSETAQSGLYRVYLDSTTQIDQICVQVRPNATNFALLDVPRLLSLHQDLGFDSLAFHPSAAIATVVKRNIFIERYRSTFGTAHVLQEMVSSWPAAPVCDAIINLCIYTQGPHHMETHLMYKPFEGKRQRERDMAHDAFVHGWLGLRQGTESGYRQYEASLQTHNGSSTPHRTFLGATAMQTMLSAAIFHRAHWFLIWNGIPRTTIDEMEWNAWQSTGIVLLSFCFIYRLLVSNAFHLMSRPIVTHAPNEWDKLLSQIAWLPLHPPDTIAKRVFRPRRFLFVVDVLILGLTIAAFITCAIRGTLSGVSLEKTQRPCQICTTVGE